MINLGFSFYSFQHQEGTYQSIFPSNLYTLSSLGLCHTGAIAQLPYDIPLLWSSSTDYYVVQMSILCYLFFERLYEIMFNFAMHLIFPALGEIS